MTEFTAQLQEYLAIHASDLGLEPPMQFDAVSGGNLNFVWRVSDSRGSSVFVKRAPPYVRVVPDFALPAERLQLEARMLDLLCNVSGAAPKVLLDGTQEGWLVMQDLRDFELLQEQLVSGKVDVQVARDVALACARVVSTTFGGSIAPSAKYDLMEQFSNPALVELTSNFVFTFPFSEHPTNSFPADLQGEVDSLWASSELQQAVESAKSVFLGAGAAVVHGDLHAGSIMVDRKTGSVKIIDCEFGFWGPPAFDIGMFLAGYVFAHARYVVLGDSGNAAASLEAMEAIWPAFTQALSGSVIATEGFLAEVQAQVCPFLGCELIRRVVGTAHRVELESLPATQRVKAQKFVLAVGSRALLGGVVSIDDFVARLASTPM
mmetsp:Transcript_113120/g.259246  ORF Transcript_113120/g.259246 Transcript_113120/m.259246 type:complete len:377 (+) Transcript_113120:1688-2818(+)